MSVIETFASAEEFQQAPTLPQWPAITAAEYARQKANLHLVKVDSGEPSARCSIWWQNTPPYENEKLAVIGHYAANSQRANDALLDEALNILKEKGCTLVVGPMDGNTWNKYRWVTWSNGRAPFFFEMQNPAEWPEYLTNYGMKPILHYQTRLVGDLNRTRVQSTAFFERIEKKGIVIRTFNMERAEQELEAIYNVAIQCFTENPLYIQQEKSAFMQQYMSILPQIHPDFVTLIQDGDSVVGYMFVIPDLMQKMRGEEIDTVIIKTVAVLPNARYKGIGTMLYDRAHHKARDMGFKKAIHSFIHNDNSIAMLISQRYDSELIRRYALFSKAL